MKWLKQQQKVEALSLRASNLSIESHILQQQLHDQTIAQLKRPENLIWPFAAGLFLMAAPPGHRIDRAQSLVRTASAASFILKLFGIPIPFKPI